MKGFALIEMLIGITISSMVSIALFTTLFQIQQSEHDVAELVSVGMRLSIVTDRLQKDLTGVFWPSFEEKDLGKENKKVPGVPEAAEGAAEPKIAKILFSQNQSVVEGIDILKECTFITDNPLQVYGDSKPRVARVIYSLMPEENIANSFVLSRQESSNLDYKEVREDSRSYTVISGIRYLILTYLYLGEDDDQENDAEHNLITLEELDFDEGADQESDGPKLDKRVPKYIRVNLSLWEGADHKQYQDFSFWFYVNSPSKKSDQPDEDVGQ